MTNAGSHPAPSPASDASDLAWPVMALPSTTVGIRKPAFQALVKQSALNAIEDHGRASMNCEVCGVLIGNVFRDTAGPLLYVNAVIRGESATGSSSQVTFTSQTWSQIHNEFDARHAGQRIVGWYHTHPGHGIFLSGMDLFIHQNFFDLPWQVALVFDPHSGQHGVFTWNKDQTQRDDFLIELDEPASAVAIVEKDPAGAHGSMRFAALRRWLGHRSEDAR